MEKEAIEKLIAVGITSGKVTDYFADGHNIPLQILPPNYSLGIPDQQRAEQWLDRPMRKRGQFNFGTAESFTRYFNEHKDEESRIFATLLDRGASFRGVLNFHGAEPAWQDHVAGFALKQTKQFNAFISNDGDYMSQEYFAKFVDENADWFVEPSGAALLELVKDLEAASHCYVDSAVKLATGTIKFRIQEEVTLKAAAGTSSATKEGELQVPSKLAFGIQPFEGTSVYRIEARLKYSIADRSLCLRYESVNLDLVVKQVIADVVTVIAKQTGVEPFVTS